MRSCPVVMFVADIYIYNQWNTFNIDRVTGTGRQRFNGFNSINIYEQPHWWGGLCRVVDPAGDGQSRGWSRIKSI